MPINKMDGKKDGKQKYRIRVNYTDDYGKPQRMERIAYGLEEAKAVEAELNHKVKAKDETAKKMTVQQLHDEYIKNVKIDIREATSDKKEKMYNLYIKDFLGKKPIDKLTIPLLQSWKLMIDEKGYALKTKQNIYGELRALLNYAYKMGYIPINPLNKVGNFKNRTQIKKEMQYYTPDEFFKFIEPARELAYTGTLQDYGFYIFFMFAYYTGARKGEINALRWCDIRNDEMCITRSVSQKIKGKDRITPPKNNSSIRNIQLPIPLLRELKSYKVKCEELEGFSEECFVCGFDKPLRDTSIQKRNERYAKSADVKVIRIHDFRHSHASLLANNGINIQEIARRLGHSKIEMTLNTYSHLYPKEQERALDVLNKLEALNKLDVPNKDE